MEICHIIQTRQLGAPWWLRREGCGGWERGSRGSRCTCTIGTNTTLKNNYTPIKKKIWSLAHRGRESSTWFLKLGVTVKSKKATNILFWIGDWKVSVYISPNPAILDLIRVLTIRCFSLRLRIWRLDRTYFSSTSVSFFLLLAIMIMEIMGCETAAFCYLLTRFAAVWKVAIVHIFATGALKRWHWSGTKSCGNRGSIILTLHSVWEASPQGLEKKHRCPRRGFNPPPRPRDKKSPLV